MCSATLIKKTNKTKGINGNFMAVEEENMPHLLLILYLVPR